MSAFNNTAVEFPSVEEAKVILANSAPTLGSDNGHEDFLNAVQVIHLAKLTLDQVITAGVKLAINTGGYKQGETYDFFDTDQVTYGQTLARLCNEVDKSTRINDLFVMPLKGKKAQGRTQLQIVSGLKSEVLVDEDGVVQTDDNGEARLTGRQYFEVQKVNFYTSTGAYSAWRDRKSVIGLSGKIKLYVTDLATGKFYFQQKGVKVAVRLGHTNSYDYVLYRVFEAGQLDALQNYVATLRTMPVELADKLIEEADAPRTRDAAHHKVFFLVYKNIKDTLQDITPKAPAAPAAKAPRSRK